MEEQRWHTIVFRHKCGNPGRISKVSVTKSCMLSIRGYCKRCRVKFEIQELLSSFVDRLSDIESRSEESKPLDLADIPESCFDGKIH